MTGKNTLIKLLNIMQDTTKANPKTKLQISLKMDMSERQVRQAISDARRMGIPIIGTSDARGYYLATNIADIEHLVNEYRKRAHTIESICDSLIIFRDCDIDDFYKRLNEGA